MKGYRFYLEYESKVNKRNGIHKGNVVALTLDEQQRPLYTALGNLEAIVALYGHTNSAVTAASVDPDFLHSVCKRIPERIARQIHPRLFDTLKQWEGSANNVSR